MPLTGVPFAGETIEVVIRVARTTGKVVRTGTCEVQFWAPGREPGTGTPDHVLPASWSDEDRGFILLADTRGWPPGSWSYRGKIETVTEKGPATGYSEYTPLPLR